MKKALALTALMVSSSIAFGQDVASTAVETGLDLGGLLSMMGPTGQTLTIVFGSLAALNTISMGLGKLAKLTKTEADDKAVAKITMVLGGAQKLVNLFIGKK